jgi:hypothetical protein
MSFHIIYSVKNLLYLSFYIILKLKFDDFSYSNINQYFNSIFKLYVIL